MSSMSSDHGREAKLKEWIKDPKLREWAEGRAEELLDSLEEDDPLRRLLSQIEKSRELKSKAV